MTTYIIEAPSARQGNCLLGEGATEAEAWEDAYGPKPWSASTKKAQKNAWCRTVDAGELEQLREESASR